MIRISAAESQVMEALWGRSPMSLEEIIGVVGEPQGWGEATVKTLINRLLKKGALASKREGGRAFYSPLISRDSYVSGESQSLLDRLFGGELAPLVSHYAKHRSLSAEEVARLKRMIAEIESDEQ